MKKFSAASWGEHLLYRHMNTLAKHAVHGTFPARSPSEHADTGPRAQHMDSLLLAWHGWRTQTSGCSSSSGPCFTSLRSYQEADSNFPGSQQPEQSPQSTDCSWPPLQRCFGKEGDFYRYKSSKSGGLFHHSFTASSSFFFLIYSSFKGTKTNITI